MPDEDDETTGSNENTGTQENADRTNQRPGAGDLSGHTPDGVTAPSLKDGESAMGQMRGDEQKANS